MEGKKWNKNAYYKYIIFHFTKNIILFISLSFLGIIKVTSSLNSLYIFCECFFLSFHPDICRKKQKHKEYLNFFKKYIYFIFG